MPLLAHFKLDSISAQITGLVAVSVLLGVVLTVSIVFTFFGDSAAKSGASAAAARIVTVTRLAQAARDRDELDIIVAAAQRAGIDVKQAPLTGLDASADASSLPLLLRLVARDLESGWGIDVIDTARPAAGTEPRLAVKLDDHTALSFEASSPFPVWRLVLAPAALTLSIVLVFVIFLSIYAVRWIIAPLSAVAAAAHSFGRTPDDDRIVSGRGPREIAQVAEAINDMRRRIRTLLGDRTRMLAAISHDLRTPLTRLRLRAERVADADIRHGMLRDLTRIGRMLDETLDYLRQDPRSEDTSRVDLPSLLQTICAEFTDVGYAIDYEGPGRLPWTCQPGALARAISNIVDNGVKHASAVTVSLRVRTDGAAEIDVADDGPGIPASLREKVFEPFFKADSARPTLGRSGFGLGLSIARDVVKGHGGGIDLLDRPPTGLIVRISLPHHARTT